MSFLSDNEAYEAWLRTQCAVDEAGLVRKHEKMDSHPFPFLRATFFRWARRIETVCPDLKDAPRVLSVGDTHLENFGTWRDAEGRWVWGFNDFDEAAVIPWPYDLVRLAASARLMPGRTLGGKEAASVIIDGYRRGLTDPRPTLLDEQETWMRRFVACSDTDRRKFWDEIAALPDASPPPLALAGLRRSVPAGAVIERFARRTKGAGGLGRPRYVAVALWRGGHVVREAKTIVPSSWEWLHGATPENHFLDAATGRFRSPDPFLTVQDGYIFRRIAADSRKVELSNLTSPVLTADLLRAMAFDLGSIHAATDGAAAAILPGLTARAPDWLQTASRAAARAVEFDYVRWRAR
ncbi:DUF2252 family protein [Iodidimonas sp. SYSU 1G8]|uniref:DUF2252 family protein n=1 Tax=Iodidimonas sp. SYSU 1G8 TaxID=3133967 RepID=UPI0031FE4DE8